MRGSQSSAETPLLGFPGYCSCWSQLWEVFFGALVSEPGVLHAHYRRHTLYVKQSESESRTVRRRKYLPRCGYLKQSCHSVLVGPSIYPWSSASICQCFSQIDISCPWRNHNPHSGCRISQRRFRKLDTCSVLTNEDLAAPAQITNNQEKQDKNKHGDTTATSKGNDFNIKGQRSLWETKVLKYLKKKKKDFFSGYAMQVKHEVLSRQRNHNPFP